ncbi:PLP-dependent aminotransferase family protein [Roseomonas sp. OT10]|uniref:aminotransferase-like domain-containing protein n=1 Tax=Roseomonas cutis TaxID=2897332 RepID=UPI001E324726|nr:PLP-dependent aminotransferase family protein [Roseomonas sp. OT10]UFN48963.1 PLP-dependent aminotransferase family protein [Roseomonas sp. OT10]
METNNTADRVTQRLRGLALAGTAGARLPSVRALMREWRVSPVTVQRALDTLVREGVIEARPGRGTFVARRPGSVAAPADFGWQSLALGPAGASLDGLTNATRLHTGAARRLQVGYLPEALQPTALLAAASARALRRPGIWNRVAPEGQEALRGWFAAGTGGAFATHEVTICPGSQAAIAAAFRALARPGDAVLLESPTYFGAIAAARAAGLQPVPVPTDREGLRPEALEDAFQRSGARLLYAQPRHANPTGASLSPPRRAALLELVRRRGAFLVEDDWAHDFTLEGEEEPLPLAAADRDGHVVYLRSLTKCAAPGLRVAALCARGPALERLRAARLVDDFFVPGLLQETALQLVTSAAWPRHLRALRAALRRNRDLLAAAMRARLGEECLPVLPAGGLHLWVRLPGGRSDLAVAEAMAAQGVLVTAGRYAFPAEPSGSYLRLSFATVEADWVAEAAEVAAAAVGQA